MSTYGSVGRPFVDLALPLSLVASVADEARDASLDREALARRAYVWGCRARSLPTVDWVDVCTYGEVWQCILREAHAWANGTVHLGADVGLVPLTRRGRAVVRRLAASYGCTPRALWFGIVHAYVARLAWWFALSAVPS